MGEYEQTLRARPNYVIGCVWVPEETCKDTVQNKLIIGDTLDFTIKDQNFIKYGKVYSVRMIDSKSARDIVKRYHYSGKVVSNSKLHLGVFNDHGALVGCLQYGPCMNGHKTALKFSDCLPMFELNRMVMADSEPRNSESMALSLCNKWLKENTNLAYLLSFSDGKENNCGYIYQANNWYYLGYILSNSFYDLDGDIRHSVTVWHQFKEKHALRETHSTHEILCLNFNNVSKILCKQHIYVLPLRRSVRFKFPFGTPYPKMETEIPVLARTWVRKDGVNLNLKENFYSGELTPLFK